MKNLKVGVETHDKLAARAQRMGLKINRLCTALLERGLEMNDSDLYAVVAAHEPSDITPPSRTTQE